MRITIFLILVIASVTTFGQETRNIKITKKYLNFPIQQSADRQRMTFDINGEQVRYFNIRLSQGTTDYWVFADVSEYKGKTLTLNFPQHAEGLGKIYQSNRIAGNDSLYKEINRPQFHFSSRRGWLNDPNGLVYYKGEYHLFYQHNPFETEWQNMTWGHAVSKDLVRWKETVPALYPDALGTMFSGSAVVDHNNTAGFQTGQEKVIVAIYTAHGDNIETQCIAYSNDKGRTWEKYSGNPVINSKAQWDNSPDTRDPKVFWHEGSNKWVMVLFEKDGHSFYNSDNLKEWVYLSHITGFWECPEFFELPVDGDPNNKKWVMYGAHGTYMIGTFDGRAFTPETEKQAYFSGKMYAAQTFSNIPAADGRRIQVGWGQISHPGMPFNMMMTFPTRLTLRNTDRGVRMFSEPIDEIRSLHKKVHKWNLPHRADLDQQLRSIRGNEFHITLQAGVESVRGLYLNGNPLIDTTSLSTLLEGLKEVTAKDATDLQLEILVDRTSIEIFADKGAFSLILPRKPAGNQAGFTFNPGSEAKIDTLEIAVLKSSW